MSIDDLNQATGGVLTDWESTASTWDTIGFPIVQVQADGQFTLTKPKGTGGAVTVAAAAEQLLYEIGDPRWEEMLVKGLSG